MKNLTFKAAMLKGSQPTVNRQSTDGQSQRHCKQTPLSKRWKVLMTLVFLFTFAIGNVWADYTPTAAALKEYIVKDVSKPGGAGRFTSMDGSNEGIYFLRSGGCSIDGTYGLKTYDSSTPTASGVVFYLSTSTKVSVKTTYAGNKVEASYSVYIKDVTLSQFEYMETGTKNNKNYTVDLSSATVNKTKNISVVPDKNDKNQYISTTKEDVAEWTLPSGAYFVTLSETTDPVTTAKICLTSVKLESASSYTVTLDPNGGTYESTPTGWTYDAVNKKYTKSVEGGSFTPPTGLTNGTKELSWEDNHGTPIDFPITLAKDSTFVAQWATPKATPEVAFNDGDYTVGAAALDLSGLFTSDNTNTPSFALKVASEDATVSGSSFTATKAGSYVVVATQVADANYKAVEEEATITVTWPATGAATIIYNVAVGTSESSFTTANMDDNSASISNLVGFAANNITPSGSGKAKSSPKLETPQNKVQNKYVSVTFDVAEGKEFVLDSVVTQIVAVSSDKTIEVVVVAGETKDSLNYSQGTNSDPGNSHQFNFSANAKAYTGTVTVKIYAYGATDGYRIGKPLKVCGKVQNAKVVKTTDYALTDVKVNGTSISAVNLATLKTASASYKVDLADQFAAAPTIKFNKETTITYTDDSQKVTDEEISVDATTVDGKWQAQAEIGGITYTVTAVKVTSFTVNYFDEDGTTSLGSEIVAVGSHPTASEITATKDYYTFASWKQSDAAVALSDVSAAAGETVTLVASYTPAYATSINIEQWVLDNGAGKGATTKTSALLTEMGTKNYLSNIAWVNKTNELDTLDDSKTDGKRNYAYLGLKVKNDASNVRLLLQDGKSLKVKFGNVAATPNIKIGDAAATAMTITDGVYSLDAASGDREITISTTSAGAVVFKQIMINEEIQNVILPAIVTLDANGGTYTDESVKYTGTPLVIGDATPADAEHIFEGWHVGTVEGAKIDASAYVPTANVTLVAKYVVKPSPFSLTALTYTIGAGEAQNVGYVEGTYTYTVELPYAGSYENITVAATLKEAGSSIVVGAVMTVTSLPGAATFTVSDGAEGTQLYTINFKKAAKDGVEIIGVVTTGGTNKTVSGLYKGDASVSLANDKKIGNNNYIYVTLASGYTFEETDVLVVDVKAKSDLPSYPALEITTGVGNINGSVWKSIANADYELNLVTIPLTGIAEGQTSIGLKRSEHQNTWVNGLKVYRPMNPVLTAITINGRDGEIDALDDKHFTVTIPNDANLASLTVVPTIVRNAAHATTPEAVISNEGAWVLTADGDNTYRIMDKDGDYTDYTITLIRDVLKHTVRFMDGTSEFASALVADGESPVAPATDPTKEDYLFQGWAETVDGDVITDWSTISISAAKDFYAKWVSDGAIKLIEAGAINTTNFVTGGTLSSGTVSVDEVDYKYITLAGTNGEIGSASNVTTDRFVMYHATTTKTKIQIHAYANGNARQVRLSGLVEGASTLGLQQTINVAKNDDELTEYFSFDSDKHRTFYITIPSSADDVYLLQVKVIESGEPLAAIGTAGTSFNFNKGRLFAPQSVATSFDGIDIKTYNKYAALSTEYAELSAGAISFYVPNDVCLSVASNANGTNKYYVTNEVTGTDNETTTANAEFNLTGGKTWYIRLADSSKRVRFTNIAFTAPKCEKPTITAQPQTKQTFGPGNLTATVVADAPSDGGTLKYQWYDAATDEEVENATEATLTTTTEGTYYVIVTNTLDDHRDNSIKSDEAQLAHRVMNDATLSALSYGTPATAIALEADKYDYRVDLAMGTIDVPELTATATMAPYPTVVITNATEFVNYEATSTVVVTAEDGVTTKTYTVKFYVDHVYTALVDVTGSTTWNWTGSEEATINDVANKGLILANYIDGLNFEKIEGKEGERARRDQNDGVYQGTHLHFNTTVPGKVKFYFRAPSSGEECVITVINNGKEIRVDSTGNSFKWSREVVVYGDVVIEMENKKEGKTDTRVQQIVFTEDAPDYSRNVSNNIGTLCVDHNVLVGGALGATFYQIASRNELYNDKIDFEEVLPNEELKAGEPYIFKSTTGKIELFYADGDAVTEPVVVRGMHGVLAAGSLEINEANKMDVYYIQDNKLRDCSNLSSLTLVVNRAYIVMSDVPTYAEYQEAQQSQQGNAPARRRVTLGKDAEQIATGFENINAGDKPMKIMIDGQIFILRGEKVFDATGRLVK